MNGWEDLVWLFTNPYFIGLLLLSMAMEPILRYLRRFYSEKMRQSAIESEKLDKEIQKDKEKMAMAKKIKMLEFKLVFLPALLAMLVYLLYQVINGVALTPIIVFREAIIYAMSPILMICLGLVYINHDKITKYMFKDNYQEYLDLTNKSQSIDPTEKFFAKNMNILGYILLFFGIFAPLAIYLDL